MQLNKVGELKYSKQFGHFSLLFLLLSSLLVAGSFEDFKRAQQESFTKYVDERDAAFNSYLKSQWKEYSATKSKPLYEKEKPKSITPTLPKKIKSLGPKVRIKLKKIKKVIPKPVIKKIDIVKKVLIIEKTEVEKPKKIQKDISFDFFGQEVSFYLDKKYKTATFYPKSQKGIINFFDILASSDFSSTLQDINSITKELALNDWGTYLLVTKLSESLYATPDERRLFSWFIFNKLGYAVKIGLANKHVVLMHYSKKTIYSTPNYTFNKKHFYVVANYAKGSVGKLYTYKQNYPDADKAMDLGLKKLPNFKKDIKSKTLSFREFGNTYTTTYHYDQNLLDFMATYPQADYETYFNAPMSESVYQEIAKDMKKYVDSKKSSVAINFVLSFVQKAFAYQIDQDQFGREKVMFAEETLYYDKSDCEDRAILFSYLVKELFGVTVVGVKYKDHMATALHIPMKGDSVKAGNKDYVIADPTYINANIGQSMPQYKSQIPQSFIHVRAGI
ncbi:hypothetical protein [Sulfurimonas sp.]|mgnify:CR=1 FL=1|uniref:hypothetical protein n=1 Tax=Sulfurimonas sp. TaxID=2022749 RepID=UPI0025CFF37C|nr:hypothetical protein [Sulfurimonas sp.]